MENRVFTLLIAEDEEVAQLLYQDEFTEEGYRVLSAANGLQVLGTLEDEKVDFLVTDIKMPDMHGLELIPRVREENPNLPIIVVSAFKNMENDFTLKTCKISAFFSKPVRMEELKAKIREILTAGENPNPPA